jgi:hypothetical protein
MHDIGKPVAELEEKAEQTFFHDIRQLLPDASIRRWFAESGKTFRDRQFSRVLCLLACIYKHSNAVSARKVEDAVMPPASKHRDGKDFCNARVRVPLSVFRKALQHTAQAAQAAWPDRWRDFTLALVDGTTAVTARTAPNCKAFGQTSNQHGLGKTPTVRMMLLVCAGAVLDVSFGPYRVAEARLFFLLLLRLPAKHLVIGDTAFGSYVSLAMAQRRGSHMLCPCPPKRKEQRLEKLGPQDHLELWLRPERARLLYLHRTADLPSEMRVRRITRRIHRNGYRDYELVLITTLLDPRLYPADELVQLYLRRWQIELDIRTLKADHGLGRLTTKTPQIVIREMYSALLAFNVTRALMAQSGRNPRQLSHSRAQALIYDYAHKMSAAPAWKLPVLFRALLLTISEATLSPQERGPEPRCIICSPRRFPLLKGTRQNWRDKQLRVA